MGCEEHMFAQHKVINRYNGRGYTEIFVSL